MHVYGLVNAVGDKNNGAAQHKGIGKQLIKKAEQISKSYFYEGIVVISGEGVKNYYENLGYKEIDTYMIKSFYKTYIFEFMKIYIIMVLMVILIMSLKIIIEL